MDFFDENNYLQLINIQKLNQKIHFLLIEIQDFEIKKKNNLYFLQIQTNTFEKLFKYKKQMLQKYYSKIVKNAINIYFNDKKNKELFELIKSNNNKLINYNIAKFPNNIINSITKKNLIKIINKTYFLIKQYSNFNSKEYIKLLKRYNKFQFNNQIDLKINDIKSNNINYFNYIYNNNFYKISYNAIDFIEINKLILKYKILNIEFKEYIKNKTFNNKICNKIISSNNRIQKIINKNNNSNKIFNKKSYDLVTKYNAILQYLKNQEKKNISTQFNFSKNIYELNIRIDLNKQILDKCKQDINLFEIELKKNDNINTNQFKQIEQCVICLEDMEFGIITSCNHKFHLSCINSYTYYILDKSDNVIEIKCPLCRQYI